MKTPKDYIELLNHKILTTEMAASAIYSLNKRAKNWRAKNQEEYKKAKKLRNLCLLEKRYDCKLMTYPAMEYYRKKDFILITLFEPQMIHIIDEVEYLLYVVHNSKFHLPRYMYELYGYSLEQDLGKKIVTDFDSQGEDVDRLVSVQFCNSVIELIKSSKYILIDGATVRTGKNNTQKYTSPIPSP